MFKANLNYIHVYEKLSKNKIYKITCEVKQTVKSSIPATIENWVTPCKQAEDIFVNRSVQSCYRKGTNWTLNFNKMLAWLSQSSIQAYLRLKGLSLSKNSVCLTLYKLDNNVSRRSLSHHPRLGPGNHSIFFTPSSQTVTHQSSRCLT